MTNLEHAAQEAKEEAKRDQLAMDAKYKKGVEKSLKDERTALKAQISKIQSDAQQKEAQQKKDGEAREKAMKDAADKAAGAAEQKLRDALAAAQAKLDALKKEMEAQIAQKNKELENLHKQLTEEIQKEQKMHDGFLKDSEQALRDAQAKAATDAEKE